MPYNMAGLFEPVSQDVHQLIIVFILLIYFFSGRLYNQKCHKHNPGFYEKCEL